MPPKTACILLVEDNAGDVDLIRAALGEARPDLELAVASNGLEALEMLRSASGSPPEFILLDLNLPGIGGADLLGRLKADAGLATIPVIVLSSSNAEEDVRRSYALHANCYVRKPLDFDAFATVIRAVVDYWTRIATLPPGRRVGSTP